MRLVRTFHPVGHGAFYTERFYEGRECVFTAVYDCGGGPVGSMSKYFKSVFNENEEINALFISHLHNDHISGVHKLLEHCDVKKIFLPAMTPNVIIEAYVHNVIETNDTIKNESNQLIEQLYSNSEMQDRIVNIGFANEDDDNYLRHYSYNDTDIETTGNIEAGIGLTSDRISDWVYVPYNQKFDISSTFFDTFRNVKNDDGSINFDNLRQICADKELWERVKSLYKETINGSANLYSMTVYSGYKDSYKFRKNKCCDRYSWDACCVDCQFSANCLYTGDFLASDNNVDRLEKYYSHYWSDITTIQVPHHGSLKLGEGHYDYRLYGFCKVAIISTKFGQYNGIPSNEVIMHIIDEKSVPIFVTEDERSIVERDYYIF